MSNFSYLFTNDLRISELEERIEDAAKKIIMDAVPTANENKSVNNNIQTL